MGDGIYAIGTVHSNREQMPKLKEDEKMSRGESDFHYSKNIICRKWYDNKPAVLLSTNFDGMSGVSNIMRQAYFGSWTRWKILPLSWKFLKLFNIFAAGPVNKFPNPTLPQFFFQIKEKRFRLDLGSRIRYLDGKQNPERSKLVLIKKCLDPRLMFLAYDLQTQNFCLILFTLLYILTTTVKNISETFFAYKIIFWNFD